MEPTTENCQINWEKRIDQLLFKIEQTILSLLAEYKQTENSINNLLDRISVPGLMSKEVE